MRIQSRWMLAVLLTVVFVTGMCGAEEASKALYEQKCASCHGKDGKGSAAMSKIFKVEAAALDLTDKATQDKTDDQLIAIISKGVGKMPGYTGKMTPEEIAGVNAYTRGLGSAPQAAAPAAPTVPEVPGVAAVTAAAISPNYAVKCASCHGKGGKGNPTMAAMFKVDAAALDLTDKATQDKTDEQLTAVVAKGQGKMPAYEGKLKGDEIKALVDSLRSMSK